MLNQEENFKRIYDQYQNMVLHTAYQYLQNQEDAEEITQDVFVQVYHSYAKFEGKSSLKTWIYRICINKSLDFIKYKNSKKRGFIFGSKPIQITDNNSFMEPDQMDASIEQLDKSAILYAQINALPVNQKTAFILSKQDSLSHREISEIMELSISSIESLIFRAKKTLQINLAKKYDEYHTNN